MLRRLVFWPLLVALTPIVSFAAPYDLLDPPQGVFDDVWMALYIQDQKAGYSHVTMTRDGDRISMQTLTHITLSRSGAPIEITTVESSVETVDGEPVRFLNTQKMATMTTSVEGRIEDGKVHLTKKAGFGLSKSDVVDFPKGALMAWGMHRQQVAKGLKAGTDYEMKTYIPALYAEKAVDVRMSIGPKETIEWNGEEVQAHRTTTTIVVPMGRIDTISWVDEEWSPLRGKLDMMGMSLVMERTDKAIATEDIKAPEFFVNTLVQAGRVIDREKARSITYRLSVTGEADPLNDLPETGMQKGKRLPDGAIELTVSRQDHKKLREAGPAKKSADLAVYLEPNIWINSDDPQVMAMAEQAAGDAKKPYEIADRLRRYVTDVISDKNLNIGFASAAEVCRNKEGDCSEHAVLLAALGRARGIPARVAMGLVYVPRFGMHSHVFGFHMWTQFYIDGQWIDFDAAQRETDCNPTHIAISTSALKNTALADMAFSLLNIIGRLNIEVIGAVPADVVNPE